MAEVALEGYPEITKQEEKELLRVFDYLANHLAKLRVMETLQPKLDRRSTIEAHKKSSAAIKVHNQAGQVMTEEEIESERVVVEEEIEVLQAQIERLNSEEGKTIGPLDLQAALKKLGTNPSKRELADMIWEVDEDLDGAIAWPEFKLMFQRNIADKSGLEPNTLFNAVQFMMYDKDMSGGVTVDECMSMLYARYGRDQFEESLKQLFGDDLSAADSGHQLTFSEYLAAANKRMDKLMEATTPFARREEYARRTKLGKK